MTPEMPVVRQRAFEPLQQEQMALQHTGTHGQVTLRAGSELCRITPPQAFRLLDRIVKERLMVWEGGAGRSVGYWKPAK